MSLITFFELALTEMYENLFEDFEIDEDEVWPAVQITLTMLTATNGKIEQYGAPEETDPRAYGMELYGMVKSCVDECPTFGDFVYWTEQLVLIHSAKIIIEQRFKELRTTVSDMGNDYLANLKEILEEIRRIEGAPEE